MTIDEKIKQSELWKNRLEITAIIIAALWGFYTFFYANMYIPNKEHPYIVVTSNNYIDGETDSFLLVRSQVKIKNDSKARATILAAGFYLTAFKADTRKFYRADYANMVKENIAMYDQVARFREAKSIVLNSGKLMEDNWRLDPLEEYTRSFITLVPKDNYDILRFYSEIYASKKLNPSFSVKWDIDDSGEISLQLHKNKIMLDSSSSAIAFEEDGIGRTNNMEEIACKKLKK